MRALYKIRDRHRKEFEDEYERELVGEFGKDERQGELWDDEKMIKNSAR